MIVRSSWVLASKLSPDDSAADFIQLSKKCQQNCIERNLCNGAIQTIIHIFLLALLLSSNVQIGIFTSLQLDSLSNWLQLVERVKVGSTFMHSSLQLCSTATQPDQQQIIHQLLSNQKRFLNQLFTRVHHFFKESQALCKDLLWTYQGDQRIFVREVICLHLINYFGPTKLWAY